MKLLKLVSSVFLLLFVSCEQVIDLDLPQPVPTLVVNALLVPGKAISVSVSSNIPALSNAAPPFISNATVLLYVDGYLRDSLAYNGTGEYTSMIGAEPGHMWRLDVSAPGYKSVSAVAQLPNPVKLSSARYGESISSPDVPGEMEQGMNITFTDPPGPNYYGVQIFYGDSLQYQGDVWFRPRGTVFDTNEEPSDMAFFTDERVEGKQVTLNLYTPPRSYYNGKPFIVVLRSLSADYYKFLETKKTYNDTHDNPFAEPAPIYTNIQNGLGIMGAYSGASIVVRK